jgi:hypothetical protein
MNCYCRAIKCFALVDPDVFMCHKHARMLSLETMRCLVTTAPESDSHIVAEARAMCEVGKQEGLL